MEKQSLDTICNVHSNSNVRKYQYFDVRFLRFRSGDFKSPYFETASEKSSLSKVIDNDEF